MSGTTFILNGKPVNIESGDDERLADILRDGFGIRSVKCGCRSGACGACIVLMDGKPVNACLVPAFSLRGQRILTWEGFMGTEACVDIESGFSAAEFQPCGYCLKARILLTHSLLERTGNPVQSEIADAFSSVSCRCTDPSGLFRGVAAAAEKRRKNTYGRHD